jgi:ABC-2 type transport system ATP-binding protein
MGDRKVIETTDLTKRYHRQTAVDQLNLSVSEGEIFGFLGPNGAGKTTTLLMLLGLSEPTAGKAEVCGLNPTRDAREVKRLVGYLPENVGFYGDLDAVQSLAYVADLNAIGKEEAEGRIDELLDLVGLKTDGRKKVAQFSRGMKQRLGIAEVLIKTPRVLFLDEPTLGLDPDGALWLIDLIRSLNQEKGLTVLLSSHNLFQVQKISHRVGIMIQGKMVAQGSIDGLAQEKFGLGDKEYSLEEIYMRYFQEV